jgi:outer membrane lipase/esterase
MLHESISMTRTRLARAVVGGGILALPLVFPAWVNSIAEAYGLSVNGAETGSAIFATCSTGANGEGSAANQAFQRDCNLIVGRGPSQEQTTAYNELAADQLGAMNGVGTGMFQAQVAVIGSRLANIRFANASPSILHSSDVAGNQGFKGQFGGGAGDSDSFGRLGGFFNLKYRTGNSDRTARQEGFDYDGWGLILGGDYRFTDDLVAGVSLNYMDDKVSYDSSRGDMHTHSWGGNLYGTWFLNGGFHLDGMLGYNTNDYSLKRHIRYTIGTSIADQIASSDPNGDMLSASIGGGYDMEYQGWRISPLLRFDYFRNKIDGYSESMSNPAGVGGSMGLSVNSVSFTSRTSHLGASLSRALSYSGGVVLPQLRLDWVHEFDTNSKHIGARFIDDINAQPVFVLTDNGDSDYFDAGIAVSGQFANGKSAFISYDTLLGLRHVTHHAINAGVRIEL